MGKFRKNVIKEVRGEYVRTVEREREREREREKRWMGKKNVLKEVRGDYVRIGEREREREREKVGGKEKCNKGGEERIC